MELSLLFQLSRQNFLKWMLLVSLLLDQMSNGAPELVAFVKTAAGTHHVCGLDFGLYVSTIDGNSGTGRAEKNRFQVTLTGEEAGLSYSISEALICYCNCLIAIL